ncbi:MAG: hypothetical protein OEV64_10445 [Desulfobulbaceae bacterium]|nr:hypothetical protein [Desulfobulbaceae bacterium]
MKLQINFFNKQLPSPNHGREPARLGEQLAPRRVRGVGKIYY